MKTVLASQITKALLLSFLATSFVACKTVEQGSDFSSRSPASASLASSTKKSVQDSSSVNNLGPGDSSGGNGINGKAYESYIVDLKTLPEFEKYVAPVLDRMASEERSNEKKVSEILAEYKTWYIAPVKLKPIDKSVLGVSFSKDKTEQLAIQTKKAIWIDKQKWIDMKAPKDRAMLLLHEITMQIYLMQFEDLELICSRYQTDCTHASQLSALKIYQPAPQRTLTNDDYDNIRAATFWLANDSKSATTLQIYQMLGSKKFDQRFYGSKALSQVKENGGPGNFVNYMPEDVIASVDRAQVLNKMPDKCYAIHSKVHFDCAISSTHAKVNHSNGINFSVTGKNFSRESAVIPGGGSPQKNESLNDAFEMHLYAPKSCQVGSISQRVSLYALDEKTSQSGAREVLALTFEPKVVFESKDSRASLGKAKVTSLETDTIIAYRSDVTLDINYLAESMDLWDDYTSDDHCN